MSLLFVHDIDTPFNPAGRSGEDRQMHKSHGGRIGNEYRLKMVLGKPHCSAIISAEKKGAH